MENGNRLPELTDEQRKAALALDIPKTPFRFRDRPYKMAGLFYPCSRSRALATSQTRS